MELGLEHEIFGVFIAIFITDLVQANINDVMSVLAILAATGTLVFWLRRSFHSTSNNWLNRYFNHINSAGSSVSIIIFLNLYSPKIFINTENSSHAYVSLLLGTVIIWILLFEINRKDWAAILRTTREWGKEN